jgi:hypothetical protein
MVLKTPTVYQATYNQSPYGRAALRMVISTFPPTAKPFYFALGLNNRYKISPHTTTTTFAPFTIHPLPFLPIEEKKNVISILGVQGAGKSTGMPSIYVSLIDTMHAGDSFSKF